VSTEKNKQVIRAIFDVLHKKTFNELDELLAEDFFNHNPMVGCSPEREGLKDSFILMSEAFPDLQYRIDDLIAEGEKVVTYSTVSGTHEGQFMGIEPTGNSFEASTISITRHEGDRVAERWNVTDALGMLQQLDLVTFKGIS